MPYQPYKKLVAEKKMYTVSSHGQIISGWKYEWAQLQGNKSHWSSIIWNVIKFIGLFEFKGKCSHPPPELVSQVCKFMVASFSLCDIIFVVELLNCAEYHCTYAVLIFSNIMKNT